MKRRKWQIWYIELAMIAAGALLFILLVNAMFGKKDYSGTELIGSGRDKTSQFFTEDYFGHYKDLEFHIYDTNFLLNRTYSTIAVATYDYGYYPKKILGIITSAHFVSAEDNENRISFAMGKWYFSVVRGTLNGIKSSFAEDYALIGFNESENKIAYMTIKCNREQDIYTLTKDYIEKYWRYEF